MAGKKKDTEKLHIRVECDECGRWHCLSLFKSDLGKRDFLFPFFECKECRHILCSDCIEEQSNPERLLCVFCANEGMRKINPQEVYLCNQCLREKNKKLCKGQCRYPEHKLPRSSPKLSATRP
ncbi:MAG: hypothetical protein ABH950_02480 [Candidatus Altiarchaeota archaeon]